MVLTMRKWTHIANIQAELSHCVARMVMLHGGVTGEGIDDTLVSAFIQMGGLHTIYHALVSFAASTEVQTNGMLALANLCGNFEAASSQQAAKRFVFDWEGVPLVTKAMTNFPEEELVQENGCWLLNNLCRAGGDQEAAVIKSQALMVVAASVQHFSKNANIEKDAHDLMNAVLSGDKKP